MQLASCFIALIIVPFVDATAASLCRAALQNPSFEDALVDLSKTWTDGRQTWPLDRSKTDPLPGWEFGGPGGIHQVPGSQNNIWPMSKVETHDGAFYLALTQNGTFVQQTLAPLRVGVSYTVTFKAAARNTQSKPRPLSLDNEGVKVSVAGGEWLFGDLTTDVLKTKTLVFTATGTSEDLRIEGFYLRNEGPTAIFLDDVRVSWPCFECVLRSPVQNPSFESAVTTGATWESDSGVLWPTWPLNKDHADPLPGWTMASTNTEGEPKPWRGLNVVPCNQNTIWTYGANKVVCDNTQYLVLHNDGAAVEQTLTQLVAGGMYKVSFLAGARVTSKTQGGAKDEVLKVSLGGYEGTVTGLEEDQMVAKELFFTAESSSEVLRFENRRPCGEETCGRTTTLDAVAVELMWRTAMCDACYTNADCESYEACGYGGFCELVCGDGEYMSEAGSCANCTTCAMGFNATAPCGTASDYTCELCPAGYSCVGGVATACEAAEGFFCPAGHPGGLVEGEGSSERRSGAGALEGVLEGVLCPAGYYCAGGTADAVPCTAAEGWYCPAGFAPGASSEAEGLAGKHCPPGLACAGNTSQPVKAPQVCDLVQGCGAGSNETCGARQSTFYKLNDPPAAFAVDADEASCMKTANAIHDSSPQWVRVALGTERLVGTVRFASDGMPANFSVMVAADDADEASALNPSRGASLPSETETCEVKATAIRGVFEAECAAAVKGRFVFIARAAAQEVLEVCDIQVFAHKCVPPAALECEFGSEPAQCDAQGCAGCVPCPEGTYSDKKGLSACTPCPGEAAYGERPYSPPGSTSVFQCEGDAVLEATSTLDVVDVSFNQSTDAWELLTMFRLGARIQINGLAALFLSKGGGASPANDGTFLAKNFPCRADTSRAAGGDHSSSLAETVCCLQDMRQDYLMTKIFRDFTDGLDLVAANDKCDAEDGSEVLVKAELEVVGEAGTVFVDSDGNSFAHAITVELVEAPTARRARGYYEGVQYAKISIPDAELFRVSKSLNPQENLADSRELFVGLLDMLPTGTRVVDSSSQQISIVLTRTQYGTFAAYGDQNIDYDFITFLNARAHKVIEQSDARRGLYGDQFYVEVTFVYDDRLQPVNATGAVDLDTVKLTIDGQEHAPCVDYETGFLDVVKQACGPSELDWGVDETVCPQVSIPDDHFGRLYIPLVSNDVDEAGVVHIEFALWFTDMGGRNDRVTLAMDLVVSDFVTWCDADSGSVDLAQLVTPRIFVGTEADSPPRLTGWSDMHDNSPFATGAETLQDGMVTLILDLDDSKVEDEDKVNSLDNLEVFFEDVLVIHVNPGSQPDINEIKNAVTDGNSKYAPTHNYDPDSRDAWLNIPPALKTDCPAEDATTSFFGCVHKHILRNKVITNETDAYFVGSSPPPAAGAQDFVETMLGDGTASVAARELGRDLEQYLMTTKGVTGSSLKSIGLWINPGHKWGGVTANSEYSLSKHLIIHVLFGVRSGIDGSERRMLLSTNGDGTTSMVRTLEYNVNAATLIESVMDDVVAIEVEARLALSGEEACMPLASLREICSDRLEAAVEPHASKVERVECVSVQVHNANCDGTRRADAAPLALVDAVIALAKSESAFLDMDAVVASGSVLAMTQTAGKTFPSAETEADAPERAPSASDKASGSSSSTSVIVAAAGAAVGVVLVAVGAWKASNKCGAPAEPLTEVVSAGVLEQGSAKDRIESLLFYQQGQ